MRLEDRERSPNKTSNTERAHSEHHISFTLQLVFENASTRLKHDQGNRCMHCARFLWNYNYSLLVILKPREASGNMCNPSVFSTDCTFGNTGWKCAEYSGGITRTHRSVFKRRSETFTASLVSHHNHLNWDSYHFPPQFLTYLDEKEKQREDNMGP